MTLALRLAMAQKMFIGLDVCIETLVKEGEGDTGAQFTDRCVQHVQAVENQIMLEKVDMF